MSDPAKEWISVAACYQGPPPTARFADLPRAHQHDLLRFGAAAAGSIVFFIALALRPQPLPSRSLASHVMLPAAGSSGAVALVARRTRQVAEAPQPIRRESRARSSEEIALAPTAEPRRNVFSRLFRSIVR